VIKLSSWNLRKFHLFHRAFPAAPAVWLQRSPGEIIASLLAQPPGWLRARDSDPNLTGSLFGIPFEEIASLEPAALCARALSILLQAAQALPAGALRTIDYEDLPDAAWTIAAPLFQCPLGAAEIERMKAEARYYSKDAMPRLFERRSEGERPIPEPIRRLAEDHLDRLYRDLRRR